MWEAINELVRKLWSLAIEHWDKLTFSTVLLALVVLWLNYERRKLRELLNYHLDTLRQLILAVREESESLNTPAALAAAGAVRWENIRQKWAEVRERIELVIEFLDGRTRRKYGRLTRYNYADVIKTLRDDGAISKSAMHALLEMNQIFLRLRPRPENATQQMETDFNEWYDEVDSELPNPNSDI